MKSSWIGIGFSHHSVPSLSNTATRSGGGTAPLPPFGGHALDEVQDGLLAGALPPASERITSRSRLGGCGVTGTCLISCRHRTTPYWAVLGAGVGLGVRASFIAGPLGGVASGVARELQLALGGAEFLVDDLQGSFHRLGTEATDTLVEGMVQELQEEQHRRDHRDHGPHE
jgi:hypothetical protein